MSDGQNIALKHLPHAISRQPRARFAKRGHRQLRPSEANALVGITCGSAHHAPCIAKNKKKYLIAPGAPYECPNRSKILKNQLFRGHLASLSRNPREIPTPRFPATSRRSLASATENLQLPRKDPIPAWAHAASRTEHDGSRTAPIGPSVAELRPT